MMTGPCHSLRSGAIVEALQKHGANPKLTVYPDAVHNSWTKTYANPALYTWLLAQKRTKSD
jgi:hypothetical protein